MVDEFFQRCRGQVDIRFSGCNSSSDDDSFYVNLDKFDLKVLLAAVNISKGRG